MNLGDVSVKSQKNMFARSNTSLLFFVQFLDLFKMTVNIPFDTHKPMFQDV